ncbi:hypothetical protein FKM82_019473 [Ascaphus truei]
MGPDTLSDPVDPDEPLSWVLPGRAGNADLTRVSRAERAIIVKLNDYFNTDINLNISTSGEYQNTSIDFCEVEQLLGSMNTIPAPSAPVINPQTPSSATAISLRICWSLFSDDTVESYQLYYRPVCDGTPGEEQEGKSTYTVLPTDLGCVIGRCVMVLPGKNKVRVLTLCYLQI